ncbi:hypothetical protein IFR04_014291 [Cadophora malorum]|uniref:Uncharacterized protein n=1 Tax=Cadophora malorum TaxID=108018 RepID=A0A8H7W0H5_9HELO|nr:hypothetical protein IFR04_014291 [Cadophora malorum]
MQVQISLAVAFAAASILAAPVNNTADTSAPCGVITQSIKDYYSNETNDGKDFPSSIAYLKNPPADYFYPPVDFLGGLDDIASKTAHWPRLQPRNATSSSLAKDPRKTEDRTRSDSDYLIDD